MLPSTSSSTLLPQELIANLNYPRRLLLNTPFNHQIAPSPNDHTYPSPHGGFNANIIMVVTVLLCAIICSLCVNCLIRCAFKCSSLITRETNYNINTIGKEVTSSGVDKRALRTFPVVKYTKDAKIQGLDTECVICLSEFGEGEKLRVLPKCHHGFHVKCIDKWLKSHASCPTCRQSLVDTCQKIIGCECDNDHQASSSSNVAITEEVIAISIVPLDREELVRNYRALIAQT